MVKIDLLDQILIIHLLVLFTENKGKVLHKFNNYDYYLSLSSFLSLRTSAFQGLGSSEGC